MIPTASRMPHPALALAVAAIVAVFAFALPALAADDQRFELGDQGFEKVEAPDPATPEGQLWLIRKALAEGQPKVAWERGDQWIDRYPNHPLIAEAYLLRGDAKTANKDFFKALYDYEWVIRVYPGSTQFDTAQERELRIAEAFARGVKRKLWGMRIVPAWSEAEEIFIRIQERAPGSAIAERAGIELGDFYYRRSEMSRAAEAYDLFLLNYPRSQWREYAMHRQIMSNLATFKGPAFDATGLIEAQSRLVDYKQQFPAAAEQMGAEALNTRIDESLAERALLSARWYQKMGNRVSAVFMYKRLISDYPRSAAATSALDSLRELEPSLFDESQPTPAAPTPTPAPAVEGPAAPDATPTPAPEQPAEPSPAAEEPAK